MDTSALATQLIGEEPGFCVVLQTAISDRQNYCFLLYDSNIIRSNVFWFGKII
jgi:hypothetical protein